MNGEGKVGKGREERACPTTGSCAPTSPSPSSPPRIHYHTCTCLSYFSRKNLFILPSYFHGNLPLKYHHYLPHLYPFSFSKPPWVRTSCELTGPQTSAVSVGITFEEVPPLYVQGLRPYLPHYPCSKLSVIQINRR